MFKKYSGEITGVVVVLIGFLSNQFGLPFFEEDVTKVIANILEVVGMATVYLKRISKGDVTPLGVRK